MDESHGMIAQGIAQALNTTIAGLAIATPAVIAHVYIPESWNAFPLMKSC